MQPEVSTKQEQQQPVSIPAPTEAAKKPDSPKVEEKPASDPVTSQPENQTQKDPEPAAVEEKKTVQIDTTISLNSTKDEDARKETPK